MGKLSEMIEMVDSMMEMLPVYKAIEENGLSVEEAVNKINAPQIITEYKIIKYGNNEIAFDRLKNRLMRYNESALKNERVFITQNLFLDLIGGNVNTLSRLFRESENEIMRHNKAMGLEKMDNRKLAARVRDNYGSFSQWLRSKISIND